jgi:hypothetical protein
MSIARRQFTPGITNTNDWFSLKMMRGYPLIFHPGSIDNAIFSFSGKPVSTSQIICFHGYYFYSK